jgi:putative heme iron utilization protein
MNQETGEPPDITIRRLLRSVPEAALATVMRDAGGEPYASLVLVATAQDGAPLLMLSALADHTRNLAADARASLLLDGTAGLAERLAGERVSFQGRIAKTEDAEHRARFIRRHPSARVYADFADFAVYRFAIERAHLVAGFGRIHWVEGEALMAEVGAELAAGEATMIEHMNDDHADAVQLYAHRLLGRSGAGWRITGIDPEGCDLRREHETARLGFARPVSDGTGVRTELVSLVNRAREA